MRTADNTKGADFLDTLMLRHHITLKMVYDCAAAHLDELKEMERILYLKDVESVRRFLVIPRILMPESADDIIRQLREEARNNADKRWIADIPEHPQKDYTLLIISAFIYNMPFFVMAWKSCDMLKVAADRKSQRPYTREQEQRESGKAFTVVRETSRTNGINLGRPIKAAASGTDDPVIMRKQVHEDTIQGELCMIDRGSGVQFIFTFADAPDKPPYYVSVQGGQEKRIRLDRRMPGKRLSITSEEIPWEDWNESIKLFREDDHA